MKNLFKNLMLVAVAAMAFTACQNDNNEVNEVAKKTVISGVLSFDEGTRSGFVGTETTDNGDGTNTTVYKSAWEGGETIKLFAENGLETTATVDEEGKFTAEFEGELPGSFYMTIVSPADSWSSQYNSTIPAEQTPRANSVDPVVHILKAQNVYVTNGSADAANMGHEVAYGKMTVNGVDFTIDHVVINLKGSFFGYDRNLSYTINAANVENNTFWFATEPIDVAEFTVTAYDAEGIAVAKTVNVAEAGKTMSFNYGRVGTFSVSGLEKPAVPEGPEGLVFNQASVTGDYGDVYAYFYTANGDELKLNPYYVFVDSTWPVGTHVIKASTGYVYPGLGQHYSTYNGVDVEGGEIVVSVKNKMYYIEFNNLVDSSGNILIKKAIFEGQISGLQVPDARTPLAKPNVTATAQANIVTLSWDAVTGADEYYVFCASSGSIAPITTTEKTVTIEAAYNTAYQFMVTAVASDTNPDYKSSEATYVEVLTEKDPNVFAEYVASNLYWDASGYFVFVVDKYEIFRVKMNDADCPNHTTILEGEYTAVASSTVPAGKFSVYQKVVGGYSEGWSSTKTSSTMSVSYVDGEYVIIVNYIGAWGGSGEVGYKGVPEGWVVPTSGDSGDDNTGEGGDDNTGGGSEAELGTVNNPYTFTNCSVFAAQFPKLTFSGAEDGAELTLESNTSYGLPTGVITLGNNGWWPTGHSYNLGDIDYGYSYSSIDQNPDGSYTINYIMIKSGSKTVYYRYSGGSVL